MLTLKWMWDGYTVLKYRVPGKCGGTMFVQGQPTEILNRALFCDHPPTPQKYTCSYLVRYDTGVRDTNLPFPECTDCLCSISETVYEDNYILKRG